MSHPNQMNFVGRVRELFPNSFSHKKVLEVGSLNINGSVREFFNDCDYLGIDLGEGKDVDLVCKAHHLSYPNLYFDTVISCEALEHDEDWDKTFIKMCELAKDLVILTCATKGREEHGTSRTNADASPFTNDYYRNLTIEDLAETMDFHNVFDSFGIETNSESHDLYFWGKK